MATVLPLVLNILVLAVAVIVLRVHRTDVLVRVLAGEEAGLGLPLPNVINHPAQLRRRALTLRKMAQVLQHRLLPTIIKLPLPVILKILDLLLRRQGLLELQLLLHFLLLVREYGVLAGGGLRVVDRVVAHGVDFVFLGRVLVGFRIHHHHLLVLLAGLLHVELLLGGVHHVSDAADAGP